jgi:uncharacterized protein YcfJ
MNRQLKFALGLSAVLIASQAVAADIIFYEGEGFRGRMFATDRPVQNFIQYGFNDRASSVTVERGRWEVCEDVNFGGHCAVLQRGSYDSLERLGMNNRISSVRPADGRSRYNRDTYNEPAPLETANYEYRRRPDERLVEVPVTSVRAVVNSQDQRCWIEREQVGESEHNNRNVGGAIAGAIIGGILGHQVGDGRGRDVATAGGAIVGGAIGANVGRNRQGEGNEQDVRHCETAASSSPEYWDVTYEYRGLEHRVQLTEPPGRTIAVNQNGEPRG